MRHHHDGENEPRDDVTDDHLDEGDVAPVGQRRHADDGERARLRRHDGQADGPPRRVAIAEKIVARVVLVFAKPHSQRNDAAEVGEDNDPVGKVEIRVHWVEAHHFWRSGRGKARKNYALETVSILPTSASTATGNGAQSSSNIARQSASVKCSERAAAWMKPRVVCCA